VLHDDHVLVVKGTFFQGNSKTVFTRVQCLSLQSIICRSSNFPSHGVGTDAGCTPGHKIHFTSSLMRSWLIVCLQSPVLKSCKKHLQTSLTHMLCFPTLLH